MTRWLCSLAAVLGIAASAGATTRDTERYALTVDGVRVGHAERSHATSSGGRDFRERATVLVGNRIQRTRIEWSVRVRRNRAGAVERMDYRSRIGNITNHWRGRVERDALHVRWIMPVHYEDEVIALPAGVVFPDERADGALRALRAGASGFTELHPGRFVQHVHVSATATDRGAQLELHADEDIFDERLDVDGQRLARREMPLMGMRLVWLPCTDDCGADLQPADPAERMVVESPYRIPNDALAGPLRLVLASRSGAPLALPQTGEQTVVATGARRVVTVCAQCGTAEAAPTAAELAQYLAPNAWVQSDDAAIRTFAARARGVSARRRSAHLTALVRDHIRGRSTYAGYADAAHVLRWREGDCTEYAVLLAAALRARGVPARLAVGMVYSSRFSGRAHVFSPHAWVQAWDGERWRSYDAALDGFDATHVAVAVGTGDPAELAAAFAQLGDITIERLGLVRENARRDPVANAR